MNGLELTNKALSLWQSVHGSESLHLQCQRVSWYMQWAYQGNESIVTYRTALLAARASSMFTKNVNDAGIKAGDEMFWDIGTDGHVVTVIGRDSAGRVLVANSAKTGDNYQSLSNHVFIAHADSLPWKFLGASRANGTNKPKSGIANWPTLNPMYPDQRKSANTFPNVRSKPSLSASITNVLAPNTIYTMVGYVTGERVDGLNLWYVMKDGNFVHCSSFLEPHDTTGLSNLTTVPVTEVFPEVVPEVVPEPVVVPEVVVPEPVVDPVVLTKPEVPKAAGTAFTELGKIMIGKISQYSKFVAAIVGVLLTQGAGFIPVAWNEWLQLALALLTAAAVYRIPNKKPVE